MGHVVKSSSAIYKDSVSRYTHEKTAVVFWNCNERGGLLFAVIAKRISRVWKKTTEKKKQWWYIWLKPTVYEILIC